MPLTSDSYSRIASAALAVGDSVGVDALSILYCVPGMATSASGAETVLEAHEVIALCATELSAE